MAVDKLKSEVSKSRPRDEKGHFTSLPNLSNLKSPLDKFLASHTGNYKNEDDLLEVRIGNPLRRVIELLEEIKKQKAFSFTLKGSLGITGVILAISLFGIFGGGKIICDKGIQSQTGTIKVLDYREIYSKPVPVISYILELISPPVKEIKHRTILIRNDGSTVYIPFSEDVSVSQYSGNSVVITGNYNSCSQTITLDDPSGIESN